MYVIQRSYEILEAASPQELSYLVKSLLMSDPNWRVHGPLIVEKTDPHSPYPRFLQAMIFQRETIKPDAKPTIIESAP